VADEATVEGRPVDVGFDTTVEGCQRCGGTHDLFAAPLANPSERFMALGIRWWATCPTTGQPILFGLEGDEKPG
jgi:hypothetical protein